MLQTSGATLCLCFFFLLSESTVVLGAGSIINEIAFPIQHKATSQCLTAKQPNNLSLSPCLPSEVSQLWKWGSRRQLFHVGTSLCLAFDHRSKTLSLVDCGATVPLKWYCVGENIFTSDRGMLGVSKGQVVAGPDFNDAFVRGGSEESICQRPYRVIHTYDGNSAGAPCDFPFKYNGKWYHECLVNGFTDGSTWCSTSSNYDRDQKMGFCLLPEKGCQTLFSSQEAGSCYEFVPSAAVTWHDALDSCRSQGADLLSISANELTSDILLKGLGTMPERMWIGLHQLDLCQGWQWSDGSPLSVLRWEEGMPDYSSMTPSDCGVLNSKRNYETATCSSKLPYICKRTLIESPINESLLYENTACGDGWVPWNGWCYKLVKDTPLNFKDAQQHCNDTEGGALASLHSIDTKEMLSTNFHSGADDESMNVWIGLVGAGRGSTVFKWIDNAPVSFTYWAPNHPVQPTNDSSCVMYFGKSLGWGLAACEERQAFMCQKKGEVNESLAEPGCRREDGWRRHGNSCYLLNSTLVSYKDRCDIVIRNRFEQMFINQLVTQHMDSVSRQFWIGLQDVKGNGQYQWRSREGLTSDVTYTNWGQFEPDREGGCAVISTIKPLGGWKVRNCTFDKAGTICRKDLKPPPAPEPEPDPTLPCPDGWVSKEGIRYCYKVFHEERLSRKRSWEEAERFCQALGANLPSFTDPEEMRALHGIIRGSISDDRYFWVGLNRRDPADRSWKWSNGRPVSLEVLHQDFHEDDVYSRDCTAFKSMRNYLKHIFLFLLHDLTPTPYFATPFHCDAKLEWICQIPRGKAPRQPDWYNPGGHHESSIFIDDDEFWFVTEPKLTYEAASEYCSSEGGKLAAPSNAAAVRQIHQSLATRGNKERWWLNTDDSGLRLFPFNSHLKQYYAAVLGRCSSISGESPIPKFERSCSLRMPFVCERHNVTSVEISPLEPQPGGLLCGSESVAFRNKCYTLMKITRPMSFKQASEECNSVRGTLVTISDQVEQDFVTSLVSQVEDVGGLWIGLKIRNSKLEWADKSPADYVNFNSLLLGMHKAITVNRFDPDSLDLCAFLINSNHSAMMGTWDYTSCTQHQHLAICQHYADEVEKPSVSTEPFQANNHTIQLLVQNLTWFEALEQCRLHNMDLASVTDILLQSTLTVHVSRARKPMWIGLFSEDDGIHYRWTDHSHTVFSRWSTVVTHGPCAYLDTDGFWKATECEQELEGAICHKPQKQTAITPDDVAVKCPHKINGPNWIPFKKNCYSFLLVSTRWDEIDLGEMNRACSKLDDSAKTLTIRNEEENNFIKEQLVPFQNLVQFVWLGMSYDAKDHLMKWHDGTNVQYSNWLNGRPQVEGPFMAGLTLRGSWILIRDKSLFSEFKQRTIIYCKIDNEPNKEYTKSTKDYQNLGNVTYEVLTKKLTWNQAVEECGQRGAHLASIHDSKHYEHVALLAKTDGFPLWIGLSNQDVRGSSFEWSDGTEVQFKPDITVSAGSYVSLNDEPGCVYADVSGAWVRTSCQSLMNGAICYRTSYTNSFQKAKFQATPEENRCPQSNGTSRWVQHGGHCYAFDMSFYNYSAYSMEQARAICQDLDAEVLTIKSEEENTFVSNYASQDALITDRVWLSVSLSSAGQPVSWHDGSALSYTNWQSGGLITGKDTEASCAVLMSKAGKWSMVDCEASHSRVVCKMGKKSSGSPVALGFFIILLIALLGVAAFVLYKKKRPHIFSTIRYKRTFNDSDNTSIITDAD
ncbi:lymphocyte antigen 75 isoform 1-T1 [Synchiropus picturatus]